MGSFYEWMSVEVMGKSEEVWVLDKSSFFVIFIINIVLFMLIIVMPMGQAYFS